MIKDVGLTRTGFFTVAELPMAYWPQTLSASDLLATNLSTTKPRPQNLDHKPVGQGILETVSEGRLSIDSHPTLYLISSDTFISPRDDGLHSLDLGLKRTSQNGT
jgi:hypothetical protein